jgi:glycosyltransferase involved in cell wall biosynthesis
VTGETSVRVPILYLAPWVDYGGSDKGTIDWFRWLDRDRFAPSLITTQPSANRRLVEAMPFAEEVWALPDLMLGDAFPRFILDFIDSRHVRLLHIMNSRLAFELLPDLAVLPRPPLVVVQLHVEETDRSGYVRYVTSRYGNLVDAFSLSSEHLAATIVRDYAIPRSRCHVIPTGVDADREFNPDRVTPIDRLPDGPLHVLYPGRLVDQKDPLLMVDVVAATRERGAEVVVDVIGEGPLEPAVRARAEELDVSAALRFHGPSPEIARWFAASDALLMTSTFEGVPYVVYEAMAMKVPVVAPALPGNREVLTGGGGNLIERRDDVAAYAAALARLAKDPSHRARVGELGRQRVLHDLSVKRMADEHSALYGRLLAGKEAIGEAGLSEAGDDSPIQMRPHGSSTNGAAVASPLRLRTRPTRERALVSVVVPCFNHGRYLPATLRAIQDQRYEPIEVLVVDDASTDPETRQILDELANGGNGVRVLRMPRNGGPAAARNAAIERCKGRYILPVDADNLLLPDAISTMVNQLQTAGEHVGYIYPSLQYFGTRDDFFQAPAFNLYALLRGNYADTCSLLDREIFDAGIRYGDIRLGHEDWDFVLNLAARGVYGEPARAPTLLYRKWGFTRSDTVEYAHAAFHETVRDDHPELFADDPRRAIKARWAPAVSIIALDPCPPPGEARDSLLARLEAQRCLDAELVISSELEVPEPGRGPALRRIPAGHGRDGPERLAVGVEQARGRWMVVCEGTGSSLLADPGFVEKLLRVFRSKHDLEVIAFGDAGNRVPWSLLQEGEPAPRAHAIAWRQEAAGKLPKTVLLPPGGEINALARTFFYRRVPVQWRHTPAPKTMATPGRPTGATMRICEPAAPAERAERNLRMAAIPEIPGLPEGWVRRWRYEVAWLPPETDYLCRHRRGDEYLVSTSRLPPSDWALDRYLGAVRRFHFPGTAALVETSDGYRIERPERQEVIGYLEEAPLPLFDSVALARVRATGQLTLVSGDDDAICDRVDVVEHLGFIEPIPISPRRPPDAQRVFGLLGLLRAVGREHHEYGLGELPPGELVGELGSLLREPQVDTIPVWKTSLGFLRTPEHNPAPPPADGRTRLRWALAPLTWREVNDRRARLRAVAGRMLDAVRRPGASPAVPDRASTEPVGHLFNANGPDRLALYACVHPITGDQLLSRYPLEGPSMGYGPPAILGYLFDARPTTQSGVLNWRAIPWASRFGWTARWE